MVARQLIEKLKYLETTPRHVTIRHVHARLSLRNLGVKESKWTWIL